MKIAVLLAWAAGTAAAQWQPYEVGASVDGGSAYANAAFFPFDSVAFTMAVGPRALLFGGQFRIAQVRHFAVMADAQCGHVWRGVHYVGTGPVDCPVGIGLARFLPHGWVIKAGFRVHILGDRPAVENMPVPLYRRQVLPGLYLAIGKRLGDSSLDQ